MTCSKWSMPGSRRSRSSTTTWPQFWKQVFTDIDVHQDGGSPYRRHAGTGVPQGEPEAARGRRTPGSRSTARATLSATSSRSGTWRARKYVKNAASEAERRKLQAMVELFRKYGGAVQAGYLLMAAQGYQESTLDQNAKSQVGAIGVMQVMPKTGKELNVGDITKIEPNIHAGIKYMRFMEDQYYADEPMDDLNKALMTFASYNAGPGRIRQLRARGREAGPRSQCLVRQRRARGVGEDRPRDRDVRQQHLQVLRRLSPGVRADGAARRGPGRRRKIVRQELHHGTPGRQKLTTERTEELHGDTRVEFRVTSRSLVLLAVIFERARRRADRPPISGPRRRPSHDLRCCRHAHAPFGCEVRVDARPRLLSELAREARPPETVQSQAEHDGCGTFSVTVALGAPGTDRTRSTRARASARTTPLSTSRLPGGHRPSQYRHRAIKSLRARATMPTRARVCPGQSAPDTSASSALCRCQCTQPHASCTITDCSRYCRRG